MDFFKLSIKKKLALIFVIVCLVGGTGFKFLNQKGKYPIVDNPLRLVDVILVDAYIDPNINLPPEMQVLREELAQVMLDTLKEEILDKFPDTKVEFARYSHPYTFETNPFALVWEFCLKRRADSPYKYYFHYNQLRRDELISRELSYLTWRDGLQKVDSSLKKYSNIQLDPIKKHPLGRVCERGGALDGKFTASDKDDLLNNASDVVAASKILKEAVILLNLSDDERDFARKWSVFLKAIELRSE